MKSTVYALTFAALSAAVGAVTFAAGPRPFLFLETGEKFATQEIAGPTVAALTDYLGDKLLGATNAFAPQVLNDPVKAAEFAARAKPLLGIVTPGFYLTYVKALGLEPLLETQRDKVESARYVLVARKDGPDTVTAYATKTIATSLAAEQRYVLGVVLQGKLGDEVRLKPTMDLEGAVFDLAEGAKDAADAVLLDETAWKLFATDPDSGGKLKVVYRSADLPRELVVVFRPNAAEFSTEKAIAVLTAMNHDAAGQKILGSIRVAAFTAFDKDRLAKAEALFYGK